MKLPELLIELCIGSSFTEEELNLLLFSIYKILYHSSN